jgi:hypothetical protein
MTHLWQFRDTAADAGGAAPRVMTEPFGQQKLAHLTPDDKG